jgi:CRP-like cAMP-binding protein
MRGGSLAEVLAEQPLVQELPEGAAEALAACGRPAAFDVGTLLLSEGGPADTLHLVLTGRVAIEIHRPGLGSLQLETIGPGHVVGLSWLSPPMRCAFDVRALEPVTTAAIDAEQLRATLEGAPTLGLALYELLLAELVGRLHAARIRILDIYGHDQPR